jgi:hypothetical protein
MADLRGLASSVAIALGGSVLLLWVALLNGFPILFFDTAWYVVDGFQGIAPREKALAYPLVVRATSMGWSLWFVAIFQAAMTLYVLRVVCLALDLGAPRWWWPGIVGLALLTTVPWTVAHIMPDIFAAMLVLGMFVLTWAPERLTVEDRLLSGAIVIVSIAVHNSHLVLAAGLVVAAFAIGRADRWRTASLRRCALPAALAATAFAAMLALNTCRAGSPYVFRAGAQLFVNRLAETGLLQQLLDEHCAEERYRMCDLRPISRERGHFLFADDGVLAKMGGWEACNDECSRITRHAWLRYPGANLAAALAEWGDQLVEFDIASNVFVFTEADHILRDLRRYLPADHDRFARSRQQQGTLAMPWLDRVYFAVAALAAVAGLAAALALRGPRRRPLLVLHAFVWVAVVGNAAVCAIGSHAEYRYQARVVWLVPLCALLAAEAWWRERRGRA